MTEKFESFSKRPSEETAQYMVERLKRGTEEESKKKKKLTPEQIEENVLDLTNLVLEKEDLLQAIDSSQQTVENGKEQKAPSQEEIIRAIDNDDNLKTLSRQFDTDQNIKESIEQGKGTLEAVNKKIGEIISRPEVERAYKEKLEERIEIIRLARDVESLRMLAEKIDLSEAKLLAHRNAEDVKLTRSDKEVLDKNKTIKEKIEKKVENLMAQPQVYYEIKRRELLDYHRQLLRGGIVETPSVKKEVSQILGHLQLGIPVFLRGHLGAGKTETVLHVSRKYFGVEPEFISGSEEATKYDIYGKTQIGIRVEEDRVREFKIRMDEYKQMNPDAGKKELKEVEKQYYDEIVVKGQATSFFQYGPLVRAMKEGRPLMIDEIDGIPHSILMRLNHVLTRKAGDKVKIQENSGEEIEIKKGFCVMATGNIKSPRYKREELDAAFLSRWWSSEIKYLPQEETSRILVSSLVDKRGSVELKSLEDVETLKRLTLAAEEIQKIFTGEKTDVFGEGGDAARGISASLEKSVLSMRDLWNIVKPWKVHNFDKSLDDYIFTEFIKKATVPKDAIYLTQLFCRFGFFKDWEAEQFQIGGLDKKKLSAFKSSKKS